MNTKFSYSYRDAANYKEHYECIIAGELSSKQISIIQDACDGEFFIPKVVGLPGGRYEGDKNYDPEFDHVYCEIDFKNSFTTTEDKPTVSYTADDFVDAFCMWKGRWDDAFINDALLRSSHAEEKSVAERANDLVNELYKTPDGKGVLFVAGIIHSLKSADIGLLDNECIEFAEKIRDCLSVSSRGINTSDRVDTVVDLIEIGLNILAGDSIIEMSPEETKEFLLECDLDCFIDTIDGSIIDEQKDFWAGFETFYSDHLNSKEIFQETDLINSNILEWYSRTFPDDDCRIYLNDDVSFADVVKTLNMNASIYPVLGERIDSVIRERIFARISEILGVDYGVIYDKWLSGRDAPTIPFQEHVAKKSLDAQISSAKSNSEKELPFKHNKEYEAEL